MLSELLLHPTTASQVTSLLENPTHAICIVGPGGAGKTRLANHVGATLLKVKTLQNQAYVHSINASEGDGIASVREVRKFLTLKSTGTHELRRVVIIENSDQLGHEAQNALLKTLEEPPSDTVIILTASQQSHLLQTIRSRVRVLTVLPLQKDTCLELEGYTALDLNKAYALSGGFAGSFMALLANSSDHPLTLAVELAKAFLAKTPYERLSTVDTLAKDKEQAKSLLIGLEKCLYAALRSAKTASVNTIHTKMDVVMAAQRSIEHSVNTKLLLSALSVRL